MHAGMKLTCHCYRAVFAWREQSRHPHPRVPRSVYATRQDLYYVSDAMCSYELGDASSTLGCRKLGVFEQRGAEAGRVRGAQSEKSGEGVSRSA